MGIINWLMHRNMRKQAEDWAEWSVTAFKQVCSKHPGLSDRELYGKTLDTRVQFPDGDSARSKVLDRYGSSLHGLCYYLGLNSESMKGALVSRCLQFIEYMDIELDKRKVPKLSRELKEQYFEFLKLPVDEIGKSRL